MPYSRAEAIKLTGLSAYQLANLNGMGIVRSVRLGNSKCSKIEYSEEQIKLLRLIKYWKQELTETEIKVIVESIEGKDLESVEKLHVVLIDGIEVRWLLTKEWLEVLVKEICSKQKRFSLKFIEAYKTNGD